MSRLSQQEKRRVIEHLACHVSPSKVVDLIAEEFGIQLTRRHVRLYDPTASQFAAGEHWRDYHALVRERFEAAVAHIPIANKAYRVNRLQELLDEAIDRCDFRLALTVLRMAAKEMKALRRDH